MLGITLIDIRLALIGSRKCRCKGRDLFLGNLIRGKTIGTIEGVMEGKQQLFVAIRFDLVEAVLRWMVPQESNQSLDHLVSHSHMEHFRDGENAIPNDGNGIGRPVLGVEASNIRSDRATFEIEDRVRRDQGGKVPKETDRIGQVVHDPSVHGIEVYAIASACGHGPQLLFQSLSIASVHCLELNVEWLSTRATSNHSMTPHASFPSERILSSIDTLVPKWHLEAMELLSDGPRKRITARVSKNVQTTLEQAAELVGATVNQFVVQTAYQEAQRILERESLIKLSQSDARKVLALLGSPPKANRALKDAVKAFKGSVRA